MSSKTASLGEELAADVTLMWLHSRVRRHVFGEMTSLSEGLAAHFACVWLLACVEEHVMAQV